ncbi:SGNH/GDSL hydrolase family protein [Sphingobacterium daejeonense]|uniref:SGNH/GDSL hydrolase family protein n=1 Tax=Sphingobacterium daejeonense TaxID=371142 RepID=UPI0010C44B3A|nr:GDSL-type esterase/lipase family protein [Sphingobacterium daejeonense]VTP94858.1 Uncharacterised protein [Sphingobacterium daejeonense]
MVGINSFTAQQLEIPSSVLSQTVFYIGITPSSLGQTRFLNDTDGKLSVGSISNFTVTDTIHNGCTWFIVETSQNFVLSDFPKSKTMLENTINMVAGNVTETVPENRNGLNLGVSGASSSVYGEEEIFVNSANKLGTLKIFAKGAGDAHVYFAEINNGIAIVKHTKLISCIAGLNVFTSDDLGVTNLIENASRNLYILCGNALDQPSNPIHGQGNYSKSRPWFTINRSTGNLIVSNNNQRFSFFIEREVSDNPLINEVKSLRETVDNGLDITKKWTGATGVSFGDSITWYDGKAFLTTHIESGTIAKGYQTYLREYFNCSIINSGQSGWDITQIVNVVTGFSSYSNIDFVTLTSGANDARKGIPLGAIAPIGSSFDASTYIGAMQKAIEHIILQNPATKIYLITPINGWFNESGTSNVPGPYNNEMFISRDYINALIEIGKIYAIPVCNWYDKSFINKVNWRTYIGDRVDIPYYLHPTNAGYKLMGEMLCKFLEDN